MKELTIGDMSVCSDDNDSWQSLLETMRKATRIYRKVYLMPGASNKHNKVLHFISRLIGFLFRRTKHVK